MIGCTLDRYRIEAKLGEGGMGVVYRARDTQLERSVALKVLPAGLLDPARCERLRREARAASGLNHPGIVTVHDIRSADGIDFIVMEHVEGRTLDRVIGPGGLELDEALRLAAEIADALASAHAAGVIHRDLKPSNVMITATGRAKVLDFGLAKVVQGSDPSPEASTLAGGPLTEPGAIVGTAAYMSPEQAEGRRLDARSDIFSLGAMLYEMLTGRRPFAGESTVRVLARIVSEDPPPPAQLRPSLPPVLDGIVQRCLRKDPARRYQTMADLRAALLDVAQSEAAARPRMRPAARTLAPLLVSLALLAAGWLGVRIRHEARREEPRRAEPLTSLPGSELYPALSPDGNSVAFSWNGPQGDNPDIYVQLIGSAGSPLRLTTDPANDYNPVWSPDGRWIAFLRLPARGAASELRLVPPLGGPERRVAEIGAGAPFVTPPYLTWLPDGTGVVATDVARAGGSAALVAIGLESGERHALTHPAPPIAGDAHPTVSPDGRWLVFRRNANALFTGELYRLRLGTDWSPNGEPERLTDVGLDAGYPAFAPGGREVVFSARGGLWRVEATGRAPDAGAPRRLPFVGEDGLMPALARSASGSGARLVYVRSFEDFNIWRLDLASAGASAAGQGAMAIASSRYEGMPQLSPDGRRVAFSSDRSGGFEIWLADLDGSNAVQLTALGARATGYPQWSPDGGTIVFHSVLQGQTDLFSVPATGGKPRRLTNHPALDAFPTFSRDGRVVYFSSNRSGEERIWKLPAHGGEAEPVTDRAGSAPLESPDGAFVYYVEKLFLPSPLWRQPSGGGPPEKVVDGVVLGNYVVLEQGIYFVDRPSGQQELYYADRPSGRTRLLYWDLVARRSNVVANGVGGGDVPLSASRDGRTILYGRMDASIADLMLVEDFR